MGCRLRLLAGWGCFLKLESWKRKSVGGGFSGDVLSESRKYQVHCCMPGIPAVLVSFRVARNTHTQTKKAWVVFEQQSQVEGNIAEWCNVDNVKTC